MSVVIAAIDGAPVGEQGLTGIFLDDDGLRVTLRSLPGDLTVKTMHRLILDVFEAAPGAVRVLAVEQPFIPQDRRKLGAAMQLQRVAGWWEAAGALAGADEIWDPQPQTWRVLIAEERKARGLLPVGKGEWKAAAVELAAEFLGVAVPTHHVAESVCIGMWVLRERVKLSETRAALEELDDRQGGGTC